MSERATENYLGIELVAAFYRGIYQGKAWGPKAKHTLAHVVGTSLEDVIAQLKAAVDSPALESEFKKALIEKHGAFLRRKGINPDAISAQSLSRIYERAHRQTGCYNCKSGLDNEVDFECPQCKWIVCTNCGACGCGHPKYGPEISRREQTQGRKQDEAVHSRLFTEYNLALEHLQQNKEASLQRNPDGDGWLVTYKSPVATQGAKGN